MAQIPELMGGRRLSHSAAFEGGIFNSTGGGVNVATLAAAPGGNLTLTKDSAPFQKLDADTAHNTVTLPPEETSEGLAFTIFNTEAATGNLVVENDAAATIATLNPLERTTFVCDGTSWVHMGIFTVAAS